MARCPECGFLEEEYNAWGIKEIPLAARLRLSYGAPHRETGHRVDQLLAEGRVHEAHHLVHLVVRKSAAEELRGRALVGRIAQINVSDGGVPKLPVARATVGWRGIEGDRQRDRKHHGHPGQGLCLYSLEVIRALQAEGHPIEPGCVGENLTISGLPWELLRPGVRFTAGEGLVLQITEPAIPCHHQARWFLEQDFNRMSYDHHPGWSRWYAAVLSPGGIVTGDEIRLQRQPEAEKLSENLSEAGSPVRSSG